MWENNAQYRNLLYLLLCSVHNRIPDSANIVDLDVEQLLKICISHKVVAFISNAVSKTDEGIISKEMKARYSIETMKAIRVNILFDVESKRVFQALEENNIWYLPLKGCIIKDYYPEPNQRQMGDIDVLIAPENAEKVRKIMTDLGYECKEYGITHHDEYFKKPFYTYEMHRYLFLDNDEKWDAYYKNVRNKLVLKKGKKYEYEFSKEDFYIYFFVHGYKHFIKDGIGIRLLVDMYFYLSKNKLDFEYIESELDIIDLKDEELIFRSLVYKLFSEKADINDYKLSPEENECLDTILMSGVYGNVKVRVQNAFKHSSVKKQLKFKYIMKRIFGIPKLYSRKYPRLYKNILTRPLILGMRFYNGVTTKRKQLKNEFNELHKIK